ncbi:MAG: inosine monophosphate cyclohydrolase [Candidatus Latescibacteria bacterium]|nr:inosine monophosphate cyclohydrolase [Candidatus Latescibacterota bacterium]MBT4137239.1 inosine monophosphate cyclohydrolase [Candidatus Latescibacterota bacterium]
MRVQDGMNRIQSASYPGRGIVIGLTPNGKHFAQVYWIMGRSPSSRNRVFVQEDAFVKTDTVDKTQEVDPLTMYYPTKVLGTSHIVTNGDQTDTIFDALQNGGTFESALMTRLFEPDGPNFTPRISGIVDLGEDTAYRLAVLKTVGGDERYCARHFFTYETAIAGVGHCVTTYVDDGSPLPSFEGEPFAVPLVDELQETADAYWDSLNEDNRVSMLVKFIDRESGVSEQVIVNKYA